MDSVVEGPSPILSYAIVLEVTKMCAPVSTSSQKRMVLKFFERNEERKKKNPLAL